MKRILLCLALIGAWSASAHARPVTVTVAFTPPTERIDNSALAAGDLTKFEFRCVSFKPAGGTAGACTASPVMVMAGATTFSMTVEVPDAGGTFCWDGRAYAVDDALSAWGDDVCKDFAAAPKPPTIVTITRTAYERRSTTKFVQVGKVALGVGCLTKLSGKYWSIPKASVTITGGYKGGVLAGVCA